MRALGFPPAVLAEIERDRYRHPCPQIQRRMELLRLAAHGLPRADLIRLSGLSRATVRRRLDDYRDGGRAAVRRRAYRGQAGGLAPHTTALEDHFRRHPPATVADAAEDIDRLTKVRRGPTQVRQFLKNLGLGYRKARGVPAEADPAAQKQFLDNTPQPLLDRAAAGTRRVFFADAAHFVRGGFLAYLWCLVRRVVPTGSGRRRYSVLGALDATTRTPVRETTDGTVTEMTAGRLLLKVRAAYPSGPITAVWDIARSRHTHPVRVTAAYAAIDLVYLPPYSPNLNLIERVWTFVKRKGLANRSFADYAAFKGAIDGVPDGLGTTHKDAVATLLTPKFETLGKASISAA